MQQLQTHPRGSFSVGVKKEAKFQSATFRMMYAEVHGLRKRQRN
jgi:hypothetical protein